TRRELLAAAAAPGVLCAPKSRAKTRIDKTRISALTDENGLSTEEAIAFPHHYRLGKIEIRNRPGSREYFQSQGGESKTEAALLGKEGLKVSFVNTSLLKFTWPGMEPVRRRPETPEAKEKRLETEKTRFANRSEDTLKALHCAQIMGCDKVRVFAGTRVVDPKSVCQQVADTLGELSKLAEREKVYRLLENEGSQNIGTSQELAGTMKMIPSEGV